MSDVVLVLALAVLGGALTIDTTAAFQSMLSQALAAGALAGLVAGDVGLGLIVGATLQLVWMGALPVGAAAFPDAAVGAVVGAGLAGLLARSGIGTGLCVASGVLVGLAAGALGQRVTMRLRRFNVRLADLAVRRADEGSAAGVRGAVALGLGARFATGALLTLVVLGAALPLAGGLASMRPGGEYATALWAAPVAVASVAAAGRRKLTWFLLAAGFLVGVAVLAIV